MKSFFEEEFNTKSNDKMINLKKTAMQNKKEYLYNQKFILKETFLKQYNESGKILDEDYKNYSIDSESLKIIMGINIKKIINIRIENTKIIYNKLKTNKNIKFLINNFNGQDGLLFVPIMLEKNQRDLLRKYLIENSIYLPIHWPLKQNINNIFNQELSLICDQRYTKEEIELYIDLITNYLK